MPCIPLRDRRPKTDTNSPASCWVVLLRLPSSVFRRVNMAPIELMNLPGPTQCELWDVRPQGQGSRIPYHPLVGTERRTIPAPKPWAVSKSKVRRHATTPVSIRAPAHFSVGSVPRATHDTALTSP
jgi:hypothetical protein